MDWAEWGGFEEGARQATMVAVIADVFVGEVLADAGFPEALPDPRAQL